MKPNVNVMPPGVLIVDDFGDIRELLKLVLEKDGRLAVTGEARNGRQAIELAERLRPHAIILDHVMPELSGLRALPELRLRVPHAVIVMYSNAGSEMQELALQAGAYAYFQKRTPPTILIEAILEGLQQPGLRDAEHTR